jgi:hypothetical protein
LTWAHWQFLLEFGLAILLYHELCRIIFHEPVGSRPSTSVRHTSCNTKVRRHSAGTCRRYDPVAARRSRSCLCNCSVGVSVVVVTSATGNLTSVVIKAILLSVCKSFFVQKYACTYVTDRHDVIEPPVGFEVVLIEICVGGSVV